MEIPNDTGHPYRLRKFVEYQHAVPPIHPVTILGYGERRQRWAFSNDDMVWMAWLVSVTYCELTAIFLFEQLPWRTLTAAELERFWAANKPKLIFNSARRYAKNMNWFVPLLTEFLTVTERQPYKWLKQYANGNGRANYAAVSAQTKKFQFTGRFAADLFLEMLMWFYKRRFLNVPFEEPATLDWAARSNLTSGLLNVYYRDAEADEFDRTGRILAHQRDWLDIHILKVRDAVQRAYPKQECSIPLIETKLCSFRNLFKGSRYGGYHHDRQLENLLAYQAAYPEYKKLWAELFKVRRTLFAPQLLGELGGWIGIRKERKKLWLTQGLTGVE